LCYLPFKEAKIIGQPLDTVNYFTVDYDTLPKDYGSIDNYLIETSEQITDYKPRVYDLTRY